MNRCIGLPLGACRLEEGFLENRQRAVMDQALPYQWSALNDQVPGVEHSGAIRNFRIAAGEETGEYYGRPFQDSDLYKWLEAVAYALKLRPDETLRRHADDMVALIGRAQQEDGYLYTPSVITNAPRYANLRDDHELYCAGHFIEAAVAYHEATGSQQVLCIARRLADHLCAVFGPDQSQRNGYPGHPEIELALVKLHGLTQEKRYLKLAAFFIDRRGQTPHFFDEEAKARGDHKPYGPWMGRFDYRYCQAHIPVRKQQEAVGHAVRALYLYIAITDLARETQDQPLLAQSRALWEDVTQRKMYITGAVGSSQHGEAFSVAYDLPNATAYNETCASVALVLWAQRMFETAPDSRYIDVMERALYNNVCAGMSLDGSKYFYVNPLLMIPEVAQVRFDMADTAVERQGWFKSSCCPTNVARLLTQINRYVYALGEDRLYVNLYAASEAQVLDGRMRIRQQTDYPWSGEIALSIFCREPVEAEICLRIPAWACSFKVAVNGETLEAIRQKDGYVHIRRRWHGAQLIHLSLPMEIQAVYAPRLVECAGKRAYQRGPLVYCAEEADNGPCLHTLISQPKSAEVHMEEDMLGGISVICMKALREIPNGLYDGEVERRPASLRLIPYCVWNNRGRGEMAVWLR